MPFGRIKTESPSPRPFIGCSPYLDKVIATHDGCCSCTASLEIGVWQLSSSRRLGITILSQMEMKLGGLGCTMTKQFQAHDAPPSIYPYYLYLYFTRIFRLNLLSSAFSPFHLILTFREHKGSSLTIGYTLVYSIPSRLITKQKYFKAPKPQARPSRCAGRERGRPASVSASSGDEDPNGFRKDVTADHALTTARTWNH